VTGRPRFTGRHTGTISGSPSHCCGLGATVNVANELGVTPLVLAGENGNGDMVAAFLEAGANPNVLTLAGESPLMAAARSGSVPAVAALLKRGANPNAAERTRGQTALMWA
jgi:ankyrin repeat protein